VTHFPRFFHLSLQRERDDLGIDDLKVLVDQTCRVLKLVPEGFRFETLVPHAPMFLKGLLGFTDMRNVFLNLIGIVGQQHPEHMLSFAFTLKLERLNIFLGPIIVL
jgi:hypothetical protein